MRGVRYTVLKNPGKLTDRRPEASGNLRDTDPKGVLLQFFLSNFCTIFPQYGLPVSSRNCTI